MSFKDMIKNDNKTVFMNPFEFADVITIEYDGVVYYDVPFIITGAEGRDAKSVSNGHTTGRKLGNKNNAEGLYLVNRVMHINLDDVDGILFEKDKRLRMTDETGMWHEYYVLTASEQMGIAKIGLGGFDE